MATPEHWAHVEFQAPNAAWASAVLELRGRVEALEAAANDRQQDEDNERAMPDAPPADGLVERVATVIGHGPEDAINWKAEARAAIRQVAAWLLDGGGYPYAWTARMLIKEVDRD